jgi:hypothetical protein
MNEKYLWELWAKCKHPHPEFGGGDMVWPIEFAELIIRECLSYAKDGDLDFMKFMIKKNFGVEE